MSDWQGTSNLAASVLGLTALAGLVLRHRVRRSYAFTAYLMLVSGQSLRLAWGHEAVSWSTWLAVELVLRGLCVITALEVALHLFGTLPAAARGARRSIVGIFALTAALLVLDLPAPPHPTFVHSSPAEISAFESAQRLLPRLAYGSAWLFAALYAVATAFGLPLDPLHRVVLMGFASYLVMYAVTLATLPAIALHGDVVSCVHTLAFLGLLAVWAYAAWRNEEVPDAPADVVRRVWSWR